MVLIQQFSFAVWIGCYMEVFAKALWQNWWEAHHRVKHKYVYEASSVCWRLIFKQASATLKSKRVKLLLYVACWRYFIWPICAGMYASGSQCSILLSINGGICRHMSFVLINKAFPYVGWACSCTWWNSSMLHTPLSILMISMKCSLALSKLHKVRSDITSLVFQFFYSSLQIYNANRRCSFFAWWKQEFKLQIRVLGSGVAAGRSYRGNHEGHERHCAL